MKWWIDRLDLDSRQIEILDVVKNSNDDYLIQGPAGSGKTLLALHFAIDAAKLGKKVLLVSYTNSLIRLFESIIYNIHSLALYQSKISCSTFYGLSIEYLSDFDVLIFDEIQDLSLRQKLIFSTEHRKERELIDVKQKIFIGDYNQKIYKAPTPKSAILGYFKCQTLELWNSYRCPDKLIKLASKFIQNSNEEIISKHNELYFFEVKPFKLRQSEVNFIVNKAIEKHKNGEFVLILFAEHKKVGSFINELFDSNFQIDFEAIIKNRDYSAINSLFEERNMPLQFYGNQDNGTFDNIINKNKITLMTIHSAKGLQADAVFIPFLEDSIYSYSTKSEISSTYPLYVAMTRTISSLYLTYNEKQKPERILSKMIDS